MAERQRISEANLKHGRETMDKLHGYFQFNNPLSASRAKTATAMMFPNVRCDF
jgi:hypothetical protein